MMPSVVDVAHTAHAAGICVVPPKQDGSKAPDATSWTEFQRRLPTDAELSRWYGDRSRTGVGYICGRISGGLELLDFDDSASAWESFQQLVDDNGLGALWARVTTGYLERTPAGGYHVLFRSPCPSGATKLAQRPKQPHEKQHEHDSWRVLVETKGEGGYVVAAPTNGSVHPSGGRYELLSGGVTTIATITAEERERLLAVARMLDQKPRSQFSADPTPRSDRAQGDKPGDQFNARTSWEEILPQYGWHVGHTRDKATYWTRPGKDEGVSARTNHEGDDLLYVFTSSTKLDPDRSYDRFGFYTVMEHDGDFRAAARALGGSGYGAKQTGQADDAGPTSADATASAPPPSARLVVRSLANVEAKPVTWDWRRWLARGKFHLIGGHAGDGKSTLVAALAAISSRGGLWPDGSPAPRLRTLFLLGEDSAADTLHPRLALHNADMDEIFVIETVLDEKDRERFFNVAKHLELLEAEVIEKAIDLLVIDPLTTIMPGTDRNDEGDTRDTLTPLIKLAERRNVAILGIAHVGKPSGTARRAAQRILGATAFHALARVVWMIAPDEDERMVLGVVKSNLAIKPPSLAWSREEDGPIRWEGVASQDIEDLLSGVPVTMPRADAEGFIREYLAGGPRPSSDVEQAATARGISKATLRRAGEVIPVKKWKAPGSHGAWFWSLPDGSPQHSEDPEGNLLTPEQGEQVPSEGAQSNLFTPRDLQVNKLSKFPGHNLLTDDDSEHLHATTPNFGNGHAMSENNIMEGAQLAHPQILRGEQVTSDTDAGDRHAAILATAKGLTTLTEAELAAYRQEVASAPASDPYTHQDREALALFDAAMAAGMAP